MGKSPAEPHTFSRFLNFRVGGAGIKRLCRAERGCGLAAAACSPTSRPRRAAGLSGQVGSGRRAGRWPRAAAPAPWLCPREPSEPLLPRGVRAVMFFLPPTFESPLPPRAHSSSRHNLRAPDLGGAPRGARSARTRGTRRRPVARSVSSARRPLPLPSFPAFAQVGHLPRGRRELPRPATPTRSKVQLPAAWLEVGPRAPDPGRTGGSEFELATRHSCSACRAPRSGAAGRPLW